MPDPVFIGVEDAADGADLVRCLSRHGLSAGLVPAGPGWQVEVRSLGETPRSFFADLGVALAASSGPRGRDGRPAIRRTRRYASAPCVEALRRDGEFRGDALRRLRRHLAAVATFELERRGIGGDDALRPDSLSLVRDAAEAALAAVLADLDRYRGQSTFATWTAKYAIREAAAAARVTGIAWRSTTEE